MAKVSERPLTGSTPFGSDGLSWRLHPSPAFWTHLWSAAGLLVIASLQLLAVRSTAWTANGLGVYIGLVVGLACVVVLFAIIATCSRRRPLPTRTAKHDLTTAFLDALDASTLNPERQGPTRHGR